MRVLRMGFADGVLNGLCLSRRQEIGGATYTLLLTLGDDDPGSWEIRTKNTVLDLRNATRVLDMDAIGDLNVNGADVRMVEDGQGRLRRVRRQPAEQSAAPLRHPGALRQVRPDRRHGPGLPDPRPPHHPRLKLAVRTGTVACPTPPAPAGTRRYARNAVRARPGSGRGRMA
ncbi:hypothetical protein ACFXGT_17735 [Streptomyces sp. NPDC059352]|uniref:hypothetical protein n=1 Tax=Streptomyces sp. NPDC059352 TaxID=3346810 RepID=UPI0036918033